MSERSSSPPLSRPPHDPRFWLLDGRIGWRSMADETKNITLGNTLTLTLDEATGRQFDEPSGSVGGLVPPSNVAPGPDGSVYLMDFESRRLKRFDPCQCRFDPVPCIGEREDDSRRSGKPSAIGIGNGNLLVCDPVNHRLMVFSLHGFVWRGEWRPAPAENDIEWEPHGVACDRRHRVLVTDRANGAIHVFSDRGRPIGRIRNLSQPTHIAIGCDGRMLVVTADGVMALKPDGTPLPAPSHVSAARAWFSRLPMRTDSSGNLDLRALCRPSGNDEGLFDASGDPIASTEWIEDPPLRHLHEGEYVSTPLDSGIYQCVWHRLILSGVIPRNARIYVSAYTSEEPPTTAGIQSCTSWVELPVAAHMRAGEWDALLTTPAGRYLTLRIRLTSTGDATPCIDAIRVEYPRISLRRYLPAVFGEDPLAADFLDRFLGVFDATLRSIERQIDLQAGWFDPRSSPARPIGESRIDFLSWLASWIGLDLDRRLPEARLRRMLRNAAALYGCRGTPGGLRRWLWLVLGLDCPPPPRFLRRSCTPPAKPMCGAQPSGRRPWQPPPMVLEHFHLRRWLYLGAGRLGAQAELWGRSIVNRSQLGENTRIGATQINTVPDPQRDPFLVHANYFTVFVPACYGHDPGRRKALERLIAREKPAHTRAAVEFVQPRFRIGVQSCIGFDSVVGRYPGDAALRAGRLDEDAVLARAPHARAGPALAVGVDARIGTSTFLN